MLTSTHQVTRWGSRLSTDKSHIHISKVLDDRTYRISCVPSAVTMQHFTKISLIYCTCNFIIDIAGLKFTEISIPEYIDVDGKAQLSCKFEISRGKLYSVKWYKDEFEFFRYMPDNNPNMQTFPVDGVTLDISQSNKTTVTLHNLNYTTSGKYRCEVSKEGPSFETVVRQKDMKVLGLPKEPPSITGVQPRYSIGEWLFGNCTSSPSYPPANVTWYINNEKAEERHLNRYDTISLGRSLFAVPLGIGFSIRKDHFTSGPLQLKCITRIENLPPWEKLVFVFPDNPTKDGIQAQNRVNNLSSHQAERLNAFMATISLYCLYFVYQ